VATDNPKAKLGIDKAGEALPVKHLICVRRM